MNADFKNMEQKQQYTLNYLKDMFNSTFDEDIIESVLFQRNWDVDRAVDDLMTMTVGNVFEIPVEEVEIRDVDPDVLPKLSECQQIQNIANPNPETHRRFLPLDRFTGFNVNDTKVNNDDDGIVILDEEEYVVPTESDDSGSTVEDNEPLPGRSIPSFRTMSYAPIAPKPVSEKARQAAHEEANDQRSIQPVPTMSYASMAHKPASKKAKQAAHEHAMRAKPPFTVYQGYTSYDRIKRTRDSVERVKLYVQNGFKIMVILRGCPGSGKSTLGRNILTECNIKNNPFLHIHSTDNFFCLNRRGQYIFDNNALPEAHAWNVANTLSVIREGLTPVIVDNTNTQIWEMEKYASMAVCAGYEIEVIEPDTPWAFNIHQLLQKNTHGVQKDKLYVMLDRYEHYVSATTLLKSFRLKYSSVKLPPQNGVRTVNDPALMSTFDRIYQTIVVLPRKVLECLDDKITLTKAQRKREKRKLRKAIEEEAAAVAAFVELDELTETDSANSVNEVEDGEVTADELDEMDESREESDSDPSWLTMDESTELSTQSDDEENSSSSTDSDTSSGSVEEKVDEVEEINFAVEDDVRVTMNEGNMSISENLRDVIPAVVDELDNPMDILNGNEFITTSTSNIDTEVVGSRLKCFEKLHDDGKKEDGLESCIERVLNNALGVMSDGEGKEDHIATKSTNEVNNVQTVHSTSFCPEHITPSTVNSDVHELLSKSIENLDGAELVASKNLDDNFNFITSLTCTKPETPVEMYLDCSSGSVEKLPDFKSTHNSCDSEIGSNKSSCTLEKVMDNIYNSDIRDRKLKLCNIEGQKNTSVDAASDPTCSHKDSTKNLIANDLWGVANESKIDVEDGVTINEEKELSDDNSDNLDSRSNSSASDEIAIADVHNTSNRFVNNDIKNEQNERRKPNINRENVWSINESIVPELNTLKERILINSLDKVFNQNQNIDFSAESVGTASCMAVDTKQTNLPQRRSTTTTSFHIIENKLKDECQEERSQGSSRSEDFEDAVDTSESRLLNQWMRGESWDDGAKDLQELKKNESDVKPPRKVRDSPSKQKNSETVPNIRLINDIRNVSDNSKMGLILDKKIKNQDSLVQPLKSTNFQSQFWLDRSSPHSLNTMQRVPSKEEDIESDFEAKSKSFNASDDHLFESQRNNVFSRSYPSPFKDFNANESQFWPGLSDNASTLWNCAVIEPPQWSPMNNKASPELRDSSIMRHWNIISDDNSSDYDKSLLKWSPFNDTTKVKVGEASTSAMAEGKNSNNYFVPVEIMNLERNKATNTGSDDTGTAVIKIGRCREINQGRTSPEKSTIELSYKRDKSTMADGSSYTLKAKPLKEDLVNIFPLELVDVILDLYDKCNGNMDWIIEILMEDGYSPSDDQLEYLSSLQNMMEYETRQDNFMKEKTEKDKKVSDKKKNRSRNFKNGRNGNNAQIGDGRKKADVCTSVQDFDSSSGERTEAMAEEHVDLFLDWCTVSQLLAYFGNPTIYSIKDYQPTVKLPISFARQLHAYLIGSIIDQAEENEDLINQLSEEDCSINNYIQNSKVEGFSQKDVAEVENSLSYFLKDPLEGFSQKDVTDVENSLSDILKEPFVDLPGQGSGEGAEGTSVPIVRNKDSFASKLSLNLLLKAFPTLDSSFVKSTFREQNFNYYNTKHILNQYGKEVPVDVPRDSPLNEHDLLENEDDVQFFGNNSNTTDTRSEVLQQVTEFRRNASMNQRQWQKCHESLRTAVQEKKFGVAAYYRDIMNVLKRKYEENNAHAAAVLINSCCLQNSDMIDLHYFKVTEALKALDKFLDEHLMRLMSSGRSRMTLYIITGRGTRSVNGVSRIQPPVMNRLKRRNISSEVESYNTGLVRAVIRKNSLMSTDL